MFLNFANKNENRFRTVGTVKKIVSQFYLIKILKKLLEINKNLPEKQVILVGTVLKKWMKLTKRTLCNKNKTFSYILLN